MTFHLVDMDIFVKVTNLITSKNNIYSLFLALFLGFVQPFEPGTLNRLTILSFVLYLLWIIKIFSFIEHNLCHLFCDHDNYIIQVKEIFFKIQLTFQWHIVVHGFCSLCTLIF